MNIYLKTINSEKIVSKMFESEAKEFPLVIQYADFNVLNYFYSKYYNNSKLKSLLMYPDSTAIYFYIKYFLKMDFKKIISTDLQTNLLAELNKNQLSVYLFGDKESILQKITASIKIKYPQIRINGLYNGYDFNSERVVSEVNKNKTDILFVGLGVGRQEKWILENYTKLNVKVVMSVGGWFQYLSESKKRAPQLLRKLHLEWLHKFFVEFPRIWKRYLIGIPKFYYRVITKKIIIYLDTSKNT